MSEAQHWWVAMLPSRTSSRAKENMSMPLKSVAKGSTHLWAILWAREVALFEPGVGRDTQACHGVRQVEHFAVVGARRHATGFAAHRPQVSLGVHR